MQLRALTHPSSSHTASSIPLPASPKRLHSLPQQLLLTSRNPSRSSPLRLASLPQITPKNRHWSFLPPPSCIASDQQDLIDDRPAEIPIKNAENGAPISAPTEQGAAALSKKREDLANRSLWDQIKEIVMFSGPATGLWICAPLMSLISTAVIGQGSSTELAALGPGTVFCDNMNLLFMFLSIATSNMVATSLAKGDKNDVQHQISILLFIGLTCGTLMLLFTQFLGFQALTAFAGAKNAHIIPAATKYVQIRGLAWPAILYGLVAQSSSLGMKDSMGPLKSLLVASTVNGLGHLVLCSMLGYGIVGAAWATLASQIVAAYMMIQALNKKGFNSFAVSVPSASEFLQIFGIAAPVFVTMFSKVAFYSLITYFATAMGTNTVAAHQARMLLKSLMIIGAILGLVISAIGASVPGLFPNIFTSDPNVIQEMHKVLLFFFIALSATPCTHSLEGTLLAGRDFKFVSLAMSGCFCLGALLLYLVSSRGFGLPGCWCALVGFQWARFFLALKRLLAPTGMLYCESPSQHQVGKLKAA
ncbi:hypothetical protein CDL15_Pgr004324 [Punica granatum]|uniref:Protein DETOXIFICATION n=1 Tax=Punica granatum TaxID=22663 RepID=A0A218XG38_PUNGR|nr:hypothetical protein CDL15_Pgr004324 [Punica granatum]